MADVSTPHSVLTVSALGWIAAVLVFAILLFVAKPTYEKQAYTAAAAAQHATDVSLVQQSLDGQAKAANNVIVWGKVLATDTGSLTLENQTPVLANPLVATPRTLHVAINADTLLQKRVIVSQAELQKRIAAAQASGNKEPVQQQDILPITLADIHVGDDVRVYPVLNGQSIQDSFAAQKVFLMIYDAQNNAQP